MIHRQRFSLFALILIVSIVGHDPVQAGEPSAEVENASTCFVPESLVIQLVTWIGQNTDYDISATLQNPANISFCEAGDIIPYEGEFVTVEISLRGAYDLPNRTIYLVAPWNQFDTYDKSVLLHELIHDVQHINRRWECIQRPEWEAYKLQDQWLVENGSKSGFDWLQIYFLAKCPRDIHP